MLKREEKKKKRQKRNKQLTSITLKLINKLPGKIPCRIATERNMIHPVRGLRTKFFVLLGFDLSGEEERDRWRGRRRRRILIIFVLFVVVVVVGGSAAGGGGGGGEGVGTCFWGCVVVGIGLPLKKIEDVFGPISSLEGV